jgi:hypothetical protein
MREPRTTADQTLSLRCHDDHVGVLFEAALQTTSGYRFQYQLTAPKELKIENVSLIEDDINRAARWSQAADGRITVFLNDAASGKQTLTLRGRLPIQVNKPWPLPLIRLEQCHILSTMVRLFRQPSVLVTAKGIPPQAAATLPANEAARTDLGHFVAAFSLDASQPPSVTVTVKPISRPAAAIPANESRKKAAK